MEKKKPFIKDPETKEILMWVGITIGLAAVAYLLFTAGDILGVLSGSGADMAATSPDIGGGGCPTEGLPGSTC